jgi:hypothetical protein
MEKESYTILKLAKTKLYSRHGSGLESQEKCKFQEGWARTQI